MKTQQPINTLSGSTQTEISRKIALAESLRAAPLPDSELLDNLGLFLTRQTLARINFMQKLYQLIVPVHGVIMEFGVRWGQNMALFSALRGIHEPFNYNRRLIGFDTFEGFPGVADQDGGMVKTGDYAVTAGWEDHLEAILNFHEQNAPIPQKTKHELVKGDATETISAYLARHPETVVAMAYFDFDLYKPTKDCLEAILPHVTKGTVLAFDELNCPEFPGETLAVREVLGLSRYALRRDPSNPLTSYLIID
ncbi:MAG: crotonobetainyl-CoA--carnitine CoA-transferase [Paraburkholderia sp.]|uniref:class I SAM-dependent methyltransferase n=1 Tax=Paraburkholderia sp. TaxID=1926495 RepID=UPI00120BEFDA|nr:class I SAM-dependent methyltransferase [Paraburkholderia sp.]TAM06632.1 MAG: crotonobetainyl-CoA--carnitine CoA-transferase [Paraburkholderia sp.]TAM28486.1 MAG: crotonobetainyl-CoA--carnitine CoA-transferase [Paraburkholderia sp.]